jgi:hypothetical protein
MVTAADASAAGPLLELTFCHGWLGCAGALNRWNRHYLRDAVDLVLQAKPPSLVVDISGLQIGDVDGANALAHVQRAARDAATTLSWRGLDANRLKVTLRLRPADDRRAYFPVPASGC